MRTRYIGRKQLDFLTWLPSTVPGIVTSLGLLWLVLKTPIFRPLYGSAWILIIALGFAGMTLGVQLIKSSLLQLGSELEEASWASGAGRFYTLRRVLLPLIAPTMAVVALQTFAAAASAVSLVALLGLGEQQAALAAPARVHRHRAVRGRIGNRGHYLYVKRRCSDHRADAEHADGTGTIRTAWYGPIEEQECTQWRNPRCTRRQ